MEQEWNELDDFLLNEAEYSESEIEKMTPREKYKAWMEWEGILGSYPAQILDTIDKAWGIDIEMEPELLSFTSKNPDLVKAALDSYLDTLTDCIEEIDDDQIEHKEIIEEFFSNNKED